MPVHDFDCDFFLVDVNEQINNECAKCMFLYQNIRHRFIVLHPLKEENRPQKWPQTNCKCKQAVRNLNLRFLCRRTYLLTGPGAVLHKCEET